jgi:hypothetical protein
MEVLLSLVFVKKKPTSIYYEFGYSLHVLQSRGVHEDLLPHRFPKHHFQEKMRIGLAKVNFSDFIIALA